MRYQAVVLEEELDGARTIEGFSLMRSGGSPAMSWECNVSLYMGLTDLDMLTTDFEGNYSPGTKQLVLEADTLIYGDSLDQWYAIDLDQPFSYPGEGNLILDFVMPEYGGFAYVYNWTAGPARGLYCPIQYAPGVTLVPELPYMLLSGTLALEPGTFGSIKALLGRLIPGPY